MLQNVFWGSRSLSLTASSGELQWEYRFGENEAYRFWHHAIGAKPLNAATAGVEVATNGCITRQAAAERREKFWLRLPGGTQMFDISFNLETHQPSSS